MVTEHLNFSVEARHLVDNNSHKDAARDDLTARRLAALCIRA